MPRYNDNAPIRETCPIIDDIIDKMSLALSEAKYIVDDPQGDNTEKADNIIYELKQAIHEMENIRNANYMLREWGNDEYNRAEDLQKDLDELNSNNEYLTQQVDDLNQSILEYENQ